MRPFGYLLFLLLCTACQPPAEDTATATSAEAAHLGAVQLAVTGNATAQPHFQEGLLLLHSFEFEDARTAFLQAQAADSLMVMAYWGEAMTHNHPLWRQQDPEAGRAVLAKLAPTPAERQTLAATPLEKAFLGTVEILYQEAGTKQERDQAYANAMAELRAQYPDQQEVAAFYALALLGAVPLGRDEAASEQSARIAQGIIAENPQHPGALHYLIHAYDDPAHAAQALSAANSYAKVAPAAAHALHMPSHIYVSMGMWPEVISSNIASWDASVQRMERQGLDDNARSYHALHWLTYGLTQQGRFAEAEQLMQDFKTYTQNEPDRGARSYMVAMLANYRVETDDWDNPVLSSLAAERADLNILSQATYQFMEGWQAWRNNDAPQLAQVIKAMEKARKNATYQVSDTGTPMCSAAGSSRSLPNQLDIDQAHVLALELQALQAQLAKKPAETERLLKAATELEAQLDYSYGPPRIALPAYELYGRWLLEQDRPAEAAQQFAYSLAKGPGRLAALHGAWQAAVATGQTTRADELAEQLMNQLRLADIAAKNKFLPTSLLSAR
ncbi:MAG: hypothetical protein DA408_17785 [Bacteroidetes bacterium]|nr:MAG: hypothetical protein C7N36_21585 [Bacteroidota bacterium]PTM09660.1 MAG: hypothetical protein DA408_17785 [Bacteroidota bacterium]